MTERTRFQIHLSSAIVMMFVAAGIIWANVEPGIVRAEDGSIRFHTWGWPLVTYEEYTPDNGDRVVNAIFNILPWLVILFATWFLCEWLIRRRAARKGA